ncbi:MAG: DUF448 domain-containing protein [Synergistaceae bacterium]|nr:DUF448 domain-containing protein [Synergistaceae bacterium]
MTYSATTKSTKHVPQRSCTVCRVKADKPDLIRIVRSPEGLAVIDTAKKLPGRGAYICPDSECIERARKSGKLANAIGTVIGEDFWPELLSYAENFSVSKDVKIRSVLGLARKSGTLLVGTENIERERRKVLVMTASDCSEGVKRFAASRENIALGMGSDELSEVIGARGGVQIVGLPLASGFAKKIMSLNIAERGNAI